MEKVVNDLTIFVVKHIKNVVEDNVDFKLFQAEQFYLNQMATSFNIRKGKYIKYRDLKQHHRKAFADAKKVSKLSKESELRLKHFADSHFNECVKANNSLYKGTFLSPINSNNQPHVVVVLLHKCRM